MKKQSNPPPPEADNQQMICAPLSAVASAFTEWERRFREDPAAFETESEKLVESPETYGESCAPYFAEILEEVQK